MDHDDHHDHRDTGPIATRRTTLLHLAAAAAAAAGIARPARAQGAAFPQRPVVLFVPASAGSSIDLLTRRMGDALATRFGWTVVVENRPGAGGSLAADQVAAAAPDGHTVLVGTTGTQAINPIVYKHARFDPREALEGVGVLAVTQNVLLVHRTLGVDSIAAFERLARREPGRIAVASTGVGSTQQLAADWLALLGGYQLRAVPYKSTSQMRIDLFEARVDAAVVPVGSAIRDYLPGGALRPLLVTGPQRAPQLPDVPTAREHGHADFVVQGWTGWMVPRGTPASTVDALNTAMRAVLDAEPVRTQLDDAGAFAPAWNVAQARSFMRAEVAHWAPIVTRLAPRAE